MQDNDKKKPKLIDILIDFEHPNPYINKKAFVAMVNHWPKESMKILISNLSKSDDSLRRKSVKGLAFFGDKAFEPLISLYCSSTDDKLKISCLKVFILIASNLDIKLIPKTLFVVIDKAMKEEKPQLILMVVSLLRQLNIAGVNSLKILSVDQNVLKAKAAVSALIEINDSSIPDFLRSLINNDNVDILVKQTAMQGLSRVF